MFLQQVSDFGLAKLALDSNTHVTTRVMGTFGSVNLVSWFVIYLEELNVHVLVHDSVFLVLLHKRYHFFVLFDLFKVYGCKASS